MRQSNIRYAFALMALIMPIIVDATPASAAGACTDMNAPVCAVGPIGFVSDLIARRDAPSGTILETEIRKPIRSGVADVDFRNAVAFRTHARIEPDGGGVDAGVSAFLELAESIPTQAERVNQARIE